MVESIVRDVRTTLRSMWKAPGFATVVLLTLAVPIGAISAIYSVVEGVLLTPLPYPDPDRLVTVSALTQADAGEEEGEMPFSDRGFRHFVESNRSFERMGGYGGQPFEWALTGEGAAPLQIQAAPMTVSAFEALGVPPRVGRLPTAEEDLPNAPQVVLLSDGLWTSRFGADPSILGQNIDLNGVLREVIGVMPPGFYFPTPEIDVWVPFALNPASENFGGHFIGGIARLSPNVTPDAARADAESLIARFGEVGYGPTWFEGVFSGRAMVRTLKEEIIGESRTPLLILLGTGAFVVLVACSNVANLFLARAVTRTRETAVWLAVGAGRARLIRFVLTESLLLGLIGGALGILLAFVGTRLLIAAAPPMIPRLEEIGISWSVLGFTAAVSIVAGLLFGLLPAIRTGSPRIIASLRHGGAGGTSGRGERRARSVLVVAQVALALMLVVGAGLMLRSFRELRSVDLGFDADGVLTFGITPPPSRYQTPPSVAAFYDELLGQIEQLPGVIAAGGIGNLPLVGAGPFLTAVIDEFPPREDAFPPAFHIRRVTPGYFEAMGIPVVEGRSFTADDHNARLGSLIISQSLKDEYWPDRTALDKRITTAGAPARSVGVVGDVRHEAVDVPAEQFVYKPMLDSVGGGVRPMTIVIKAEGDPLSLAPAVRGIVESMDADLPISDMRTMDDVVRASLSRTSFTMILLAIAAGIALFLGAVGIYGTISYVVTERTREIGVWQALGADPRAILGMVLARGMSLAGIGIAIGLLGAAVLGRVISSLLYEVTPYDATTLLVSSGVFLAVAALAAVIPAARAARIPPAVAIRSD